jgi:hypothetical protein
MEWERRGQSTPPKGRGHEYRNELNSDSPRVDSSAQMERGGRRVGRGYMTILNDVEGQ